MSSATKRTFVDRDDFDVDHYADCIRDLHRSRITLDQLDIARRQLRKKEKLLSRTHQLKMKEHIRVKNDFIRKVEQDDRISKLPAVKETLKGQQYRQQQQQQQPSSPSPIPIEKMIIRTKNENNLHPSTNQSKVFIEPHSPRKERLKANIVKFNHQNPLLV